MDAAGAGKERVQDGRAGSSELGPIGRQRLPFRPCQAVDSARNRRYRDCPSDTSGAAVTEYEGFRVDRDGGGVVMITLDDPEKMNRVPLAARGQLAHLFAESAEDDAVRVMRTALRLEE